MSEIELTDKEIDIGGLLAIAESQQGAVENALTGLRRLQGDLTQAVTAMEALEEKLPPTVSQSAAKEVTSTLRAHLSTLSKDVMKVQEIAFKPLVKQLNDTTTAAVAANQALKKTMAGIEGALTGAKNHFDWRWGLTTLTLGGGAMVTLVAIAWITVSWQTDQVIALQEQKQQLSAEIAQGQKILAQLPKETDGIRYAKAIDGRFIVVPNGFDLAECAPDHIPCIRLK